MSKVVTRIILVVALAFIGYLLFDLGGRRAGEGFKAKLDSLDKVNDSLYIENAKDDSTIGVLVAYDKELEYELSHQKTKIIRIKEYVDSSKQAVDTYTEQQIVGYFNAHYPTDTVTNPLPIAQPVLVSAAKDLIAFEGAKKEVEVQDSIIALQDTRIVLKDSTITLYQNKEVRYRAVIDNKDQAIAEWSKQFSALQLENKKLKLKSKFQRIASAVIIGGLAFTLIAK